MSIDFDKFYAEVDSDAYAKYEEYIMCGYDSSYWSMDDGHVMSDDEAEYWFNKLEKRGFV